MEGVEVGGFSDSDGPFRSKCASKRVEVPNLAQASKSELLVAVKGREGPTIPSIYVQRLLVSPKYNAATSLEKFGSQYYY